MTLLGSFCSSSSKSSYCCLEICIIFLEKLTVVIYIMRHITIVNITIMIMYEYLTITTTFICRSIVVPRCSTLQEKKRVSHLCFIYRTRRKRTELKPKQKMSTFDKHMTRLVHPKPHSFGIWLIVDKLWLIIVRSIEVDLNEIQLNDSRPIRKIHLFFVLFPAIAIPTTTPRPAPSRWHDNCFYRDMHQFFRFLRDSPTQVLYLQYWGNVVVVLKKHTLTRLRNNYFLYLWLEWLKRVLLVLYLYNYYGTITCSARTCL